jgi:hypothetical protein
MGLSKLGLLSLVVIAVVSAKRVPKRKYQDTVPTPENHPPPGDSEQHQGMPPLPTDGNVVPLPGQGMDADGNWATQGDDAPPDMGDQKYSEMIKHEEKNSGACEGTVHQKLLELLSIDFIVQMSASRLLRQPMLAVCMGL